MNNSGTLNNMTVISSVTDCFPQFRSDFFNLYPCGEFITYSWCWWIY